MNQVEFIYDDDCPNVERARKVLINAFSLAKQIPSWKEWSRSDLNSPDYVQRYGSPSILVNGRDIVEAQTLSDTSCCRIYEGEQGRFQGFPTIDSVVTALQENGKAARNRGWITSLPTVGAVLVPKLVCPSCIPALAALASSAGISVMEFKPFLTLFTLILLGVAVLSLSYKGEQRRGRAPFYLGLLSGAVMLLGQYSWQSLEMIYLGIAMLIAASIWNAWPKRGECSACLTETKGETS